MQSGVYDIVRQCSRRGLWSLWGIYFVKDFVKTVTAVVEEPGIEQVDVAHKGVIIVAFPNIQMPFEKAKEALVRLVRPRLSLIIFTSYI